MQRWEVFEEVRPFGRGAIADIVARQSNRIWVIECKTSLSLALLGQALGWRGLAHWISIAYPRTRRYTAGWNAAVAICHNFGIGRLMVDRSDIEDTPPQLMRRVGLDWNKVLCNEHKTMCVAGSAGGGYFTPVKRTGRALEKYVRENPGCTFKAAVAEIQHHYARDSIALSCLRRWVADGVINGIRVDEGVRPFRLWPSPHTKGDAP